jgi:hypothetical protein
MKMLNLDSLLTPTKTVIIAGIEHTVKDMGVGDFLEASADARKLENKDDIAANLEASARHVRRLIPTLTEEDVRALKLEQLFTLIQFLNGTLEELQQTGEAIAEKESEGK